MSNDIYVVVEHANGAIADVTFELLGMGRRIASSTGGELVAVLLGSGMGSAASGLGGADRVVSVDHAALKEFNPETYTAALTEVIGAKAPRLTLIAYTSMGMDLGSAVAIRKDLPIVSSAIDVQADGGSLVVTSQLYGGKIVAQSEIAGPAAIVTVLAGASPADAGRKDGSPAVEEVAPPASLNAPKIRFQELIQPEGGDVDITQQDILVAVGRGIQSSDNIPMAEELAAALGGAVCSSRPIVDNKWLAKSRQVGKSGLKVKPKIYIALGISGAPEHIEGMKDAELIIAVNTDENAPIFEHAHFGTTEDLFDVIPALTEKLKR